MALRSPCGEECALDDEGGKEYDGAFELRTPFVVASDGVRRTVARRRPTSGSRQENVESIRWCVWASGAEADEKGSRLAVPSLL